MSPLIIKIPSTNKREKPTNEHQLFIQFINYVWYILHVGDTIHN
jgi:hypothetical protein